jgi:hypothetical protein
MGDLTGAGAGQGRRGLWTAKRAKNAKGSVRARAHDLDGAELDTDSKDLHGFALYDGYGRQPDKGCDDECHRIAYRACRHDI